MCCLFFTINVVIVTMGSNGKVEDIWWTTNGFVGVWKLSFFFFFVVVDVCVEYPLNLTPIKCLLVFSKLGNCLIDWTLYRSNRKHYFRLCILYLELYFLYLFVFSNTNTIFSVHFGCGCNVQIVYCIVVMVYYFIVLLYLMVCSCPNCKCNNR